MGFAFMFGGVGNVAALGGQTPLVSEFKLGEWGIIGYQGFLLTGMAYDVGVFAFFFFQMVFMDTTCTIPTGGVAERVKLSAVILNAFSSPLYIIPSLATGYGEAAGYPSSVLYPGWGTESLTLPARPLSTQWEASPLWPAPS